MRPVPGVGPRVHFDVSLTGWDLFLSWVLPTRALARRVAREQIRFFYGGRMPETPLFLLTLPNGSIWRVLNAAGAVAPFEET
jgi:hypothetical protein